MSTPEQIQRDIEGTRESLRTDVDRLTEKVSPGRVVGRRVERAKGGAHALRERVMGSVPDARSGASSAKDAVSSAASTVGDAVTSAPEVVRKQTQGSPLAAGVVAFGVGMVVASLFPATEQEEQLAQQAEQKAVGPVQEKAKEVAQELREPAQQAAQEVKQSVTDAASRTAQDAKSAAEDVKAPLQR
jgi:ElaB/YqjD/DUF883 family membrane-anchored ribosome-binding protein